MQLRELLEPVPHWSTTMAAQPPYWVDHVPAFADRLEMAYPKNVAAVVALRPRRGIRRRPWLRLVTIATGRSSEFAVIELLARDLAPTVLQTGIVPIVEPLFERSIGLWPSNSPGVRLLQNRGFLLYEHAR